MGEPTEDQVWLKDAMDRYDLTKPQIARLAEASLSLVRAWLSDTSSVQYRPMRAVYRGMLETRLARRRPAVRV